MKIRHACLLSVLAGLAASATAQDIAGPLPIRQITLPVVGAPAQPYSGRAIQTTYDCLSNTFGNASATHLGTCSNVIEDISFNNSAWAQPGYTLPRVITEITYGVGVLTTATTTEDILVIFWDQNDLNFQGQGGAGTPMMVANAIPLAVLRVDAAGLANGFYWQITNALTGLAGGGVTVPPGDAGIAVQIAWVDDAFTPADTNGDTVPNWENLAGGTFEGCASTTNRAIVFGSQSGAPVGANPAAPGFTLPDYGRDISNAAMCPNIGFFVGNGGAAVAAGNDEHRFVNATPSRGMMVRLKGDVLVPPPACNTTLGGIPDAGTSSSQTVAANGVNIVCFTLNGDASDAAAQFLDIDTDVAGNADASIALWDSGGALVAFDDDGGSGTNSKLSFGIGIRQKDGDGTQFNGRDGQLAAGTYFLGVATGLAGDSSFGDAYNRSSTGPGGSVTVRFRTNTNGAALAASVTPDLTEAAFNGGAPLAAPGAQSTASATGLRGLLWYSFNTCAIDGTNYLDIDTNSGSTATADTEIFVFDNTGTLVATDDDSGTAALSQLSFGNVGPRPQPGDGLPYAGQNGNLPAGTYYVGVGLFDVTTTGNRWHLRATSGSNLNVQLSLATDSSGTCPVGCHGDCVADFDDGSGTGTPDGGVTIDDLLYYLGIFEAGVICADVDDGSGTGTQDMGVTIDDLLYYLFRFEAGC